MFKERLKTFLLLSLVCISIFLTKKLWLEIPYDVLSFFHRQEAMPPSYLFEDMIKPHKYLLNFDKKNHTIFYSDDGNGLWSNMRSNLIEVLSSNNIEYDILPHEDFLTYNGKKSIIFYFPEKFNTYIIARSLGVNKPNNITETMPKMDSIYFHLSNEEPFFVFSEGDTHLKVYDENVDAKIIREWIKDIENRKEYTYYYSMKDTLEIDNDIFIPYEMSRDLPLIHVVNELDAYNLESMRDLAEKFYGRDIDYIREIIEDDGSIIYVYNQRVLKINQNGILEYFNPLEEPVKERNLYMSLNTTAEFLSRHLQTPNDMYLAKIEDIEVEDNLGYRLTFRYRIGGIPVVIGSDAIKDFIQVDVFNKYIRNYKRFIRKDIDVIYTNTNNTKALSAFDIINMNYKLLEKEYIKDKDLSIEDKDREIVKERVLSSIQNIYIAYLDSCSKEREELIGAWVLQMENGIYAFDIYSGNMIMNKE